MIQKSNLLSTILFLFFSFTIATGQNTVTLSFNSSSTIDSIKIENLSNKTSRTIRSSSITLLLDVADGITETQAIGKLQAYPNPFKTYTFLEIPVIQQSDISIAITGLSGKILAQLNKNIEPGLHRFTFNAGKSGMYLVKVSDKNTTYNTKLICTEYSSNHPRLEYNGIASTQTNFRNKAKELRANLLADLKINTGDKLQFTGYANSRTKSLTDFASVSKDYNFNFIDNLWECLDKDLQLDSISSYLKSFDITMFDQTKSTAIDVNEYGEVIYKDSFFYTVNKKWSELGALNNEDSTYQVIYPTNTAWNTAYNVAKEFYKYSSNTPETKIIADTLKRHFTMKAITKDLIFSKTMQAANSETLTSTSGNTFVAPFAGALEIPASNGKAYIFDRLNFEPSESWHTEIRIEAEQAKGRTNTYSNLYHRLYSGDKYGEISKSGYIEVNASTISIDPSVIFEIPNTLSGKLNADSTLAYGARYNIYCVFVPEAIRTLNPKPNKVEFSIEYLNESLNRVEIKYDNNKNYFITDKEKLTKVLVASNFTFPFSEYGFENSNVTIRVKSNVKRAETVEYTKDLLIDCIILEPVR